MFRVILVYTIFAYFHTIPSLYLLYIFSWRITSAAEILYFRHGYKTLQISQNKITYLITKETLKIDGVSFFCYHKCGKRNRDTLRRDGKIMGRKKSF